MRHCGCFILLMLMSAFDPTSVFANFPFSLEPVVALTVGLLLLYKIQLSLGFEVFFKRYKLEMALLSFYFLWCVISLYFNFHRYGDSAQFIRYGVTLLAISATFPLAMLLFSLPQTTRGPSLTGGGYGPVATGFLLLGVALLGIWQFVDFDSSKSLTQFFHSARMWDFANINSIFNIHTDFGSIMAVTALMSLSLLTLHFRYVNCVDRNICLWLIAIAICAFIAGSVSGSRNFVLTFVVGFLLHYLLNWRHIVKLSSFIWALLVAVLVVHILILASPAFTQNFGKALPYINMLSLGEPLVAKDFLLNFSDGSFSGRGEIWQRAWSHFVANPWLGISNGGFRLLPGALEYQNAHNIFLQLLIEAGVIGIIAIVTLVVVVYRRLFKCHEDSNTATMYFNILLPLLVALMVNLSFDYYIDHTYGWILVVAFGFGFITNKLKQASEQQDTHGVVVLDEYSIVSNQRAITSLNGLIKLYSVAIFLACLALIGANFYSQHLLLSQLSSTERLGTVIDKIGGEFEMVFVDNHFEFSAEDKKLVMAHKLNFIAVNEQAIDASLCPYTYPNSQFFYRQPSVDNHQAVTRYYYSDGDSRVAHTESRHLSCSEYQYLPVEMTDASLWASNRVLTKTADRGDWELRGDVDIHSTIHTIQSGDYQLEFTAQGQLGLSESPELKIELWDSDANELLNSTILAIFTNKKRQYRVDFSASKTSNGYLKLSFINDAESPATNQSRMIVIYPETIKISQL